MVVGGGELTKMDCRDYVTESDGGKRTNEYLGTSRKILRITG